MNDPADALLVGEEMWCCDCEAGAGVPECRNDGEPGTWVSWGSTPIAAAVGATRSEALGMPLLAAGDDVMVTAHPLTGRPGVILDGPDADGRYAVEVRMADGSWEVWELFAPELRPA